MSGSNSDFIYSTANFGEPEPLANRQSTILGICIAMMAASWICVTGRIYVRLRIVQSAGWDDILVALYLITTTCGTIAVCTATNFGLGQHLLLIPPESFRMYLVLFYLANGCYIASTTFIKLSLLFQYLRIFGEGSAIRKFCLFLIVLISLWGFTYSFMAFFPCFPVSDFWEPLTTAGTHCYAFGARDPATLNASYESHTAVNMVFDVLVLAIPIPLYFEKDTPKKAKRGLLVLLFMGFLVNVFAVWRLATILEHKTGTFPVEDPTWYGPITILLAVLEVDAASICASVPVFWPVLSQRLGQIFVTKEFAVVHEERYDIETLNSPHSIPPSPHTPNSRMDSQTELSRSALRSKTSKVSTKEGHYDDAFVMSHVDPLAKTSRAAVHGGETKKEKRMWFRF